MSDHEISLAYQEFVYIRRQARDTISGSSKIKYSNVLYLPMPSSFLEVPNEASPSLSNSVESKFNKSIPIQDIPWWHPNPAYRSYLQRARFPEITGAALIGMLGFACKTESKIELPTEMEYLLEAVSPNGKKLLDFYLFVLSEVLSVGNYDVVVDYDIDNDSFYLAGFIAENQIDWNLSCEKGVEKIDYVKFIEHQDDDDVMYVKYKLDDSGVPSYVRYLNDEIVDPEEELSYKGRKYPQIPVFPAGSFANTLDPQKIPIIGISDIAITLYQIDADLRQSEFMTCNPTLFCFGVGEKDKPKVIGSTVVVAISNPNARAEYIQTDAGALNHMLSRKEDLFKEAVSYGANFIQNSGNKESAESLSIRKSSHGINLLTVVKNVGSCVEKALKFIAIMKGLDAEKVVFTPSTEFAEMIYTAQDLTALASLWMQRAIDHDTLLDNVRKGGYIPNEKTNEAIKELILLEPPMVTGSEEDEDKDEDKKEESKDKE